MPAKEKDILRVYSMRLCPYAERARIILLAKKLPHEIVNIDLKKKPDWYLKINPQGKQYVMKLNYFFCTFGHIFGT